ncbi:MAG: hypothetical protein AAF787_08770 [Chloroflexota bacterium]
MTLQQRLKQASGQSKTRPDNDPDLCRLQELWVRVYGDERHFEPIYQKFRADPDARLTDYIRQYHLSQ